MNESRLFNEYDCPTHKGNEILKALDEALSPILKPLFESGVSRAEIVAILEVYTGDLVSTQTLLRTVKKRKQERRRLTEKADKVREEEQRLERLILAKMPEEESYW